MRAKYKTFMQRSSHLFPIRQEFIEGIHYLKLAHAKVLARAKLF